MTDDSTTEPQHPGASAEPQPSAGASPQSQQPAGPPAAPPPPSGPPIETGSAPVAAHPGPPAVPLPAPTPAQVAAAPTGPPLPGAAPSVGSPPPGPGPLAAPLPAPRRGLPLGAILGIAGGALALLLVIVIVVVVVVVPRIGGGPGPDQIVAGYLKAVAASDAKTALSYIGEANQPDDTTFLTDSALRASNKLGPIRGIKVTKPAKARSFVDVIARYTIGGTPVVAKFTVDHLNGGWELESGPADIDLGSRFQGVDLTLNGTKVRDGKATVFPGTYVLATTTEDFAIGGTPQFVVKDGYDPTTLGEAALTLSDAGLVVFRQAVADAVAPCIASKTLSAGCGLDLPATLSDGTQLEDGTITRTLDAEAQSTLAGLKPREFLRDTRAVSSESIGGVDATAACTKNGQRGTCKVLFGPTLGEATVDFTTDPPTVRW